MRGLDPAATLVREVMSRDVAFCFSDDNVPDAIGQMERKHIRRLAVVNHDKTPAGVLSVDDVAKYSRGLAGEVIDLARPGHYKDVFVFGADLAGRHREGDALKALRHHGAVYGRGAGLQGRSYAIPVRDEQDRLLPIAMIARYVQAFLRFAAIYTTMTLKKSAGGIAAGA
ncbi:MAG: hypothetical protein A3G24_22365 [Betaproteobacteria bacterium RIFCSPLOWO2_12_FULL_62_13]|nr:MAG: hypothetical protein A3G24_22365 [Betaproteobacteria bacterium RIFCSPLOWO2_12_FULL_62_13]